MTDMDFRVDPAIDEELETPKRVELRDPVTNDPIFDETGAPAFVMVYSAQSKIFKRRAFKLEGRLKSKARRQGKGDLTFEEQNALEAQIYAAAFGDEWNIVRRANGKAKKIDAPCTQENAAKWVEANPLYKPQINAVTDDIEAFLNGEEGNFTKEASPPSTKASKAR